MSKIRISGDTSGYIDVTVPAVAGSGTVSLDQVALKDEANTFTDNVTITGNVDITGTTEIKSANALKVWRSDNTRAGQFYTNNTHTVLESSATGNDPLTLISPGSTGSINMRVGSTTNLFTLHSSGNITTSTHAMFDANMTTGGYTTTLAVVYAQVNINRGNCYNSSNGRFTAPVTGMYFFYTSMIKNNASSTVCRRSFRKNGAEILGGRHLRMDSGQSYGDNGTFNHLISLSAGDYVTVAQTAGNSYGNTDYDFFGGYLVG